MPEFELGGKRPEVHPEAYVAPTAVLIGDVHVAARATVWFGAVLRGDESTITVGEGTNIQDNAVVHCSKGLPTVIGARVTLGHNACVEGCVIEDGALVGTGAIMLQRTRLGARALLAAGSLLAEDETVPADHLAAGVPAKVKKPLSGSSAHWPQHAAEHYEENGRRFRDELLPLARRD
ncbi:MAG: gamma carbonic anhydrase family protein [Candidatus Dormibacteraeota bacterium]|uniref:Gamma carbonic anhydrase family protein n=1 Tax=Candidatus Dormiibacter inghamiae TaxID=3127013 RepID=A0A934KEV8_9BACT|nr:gamma carbonic anhydrase family protein [Candidatus Dormibacteraeota bacterium]MBJ7607731.1 gamma carbonic anhydrase family protein [Candidatus Dormibacteraeota bacterium]